MPKTPVEKAAGKLISAIQKEWGKENGESTAVISERVMNRGHELLQAAKHGQVRIILGGRSVTQYLGELWVKRHPSVASYITQLENEIDAE